MKRLLLITVFLGLVPLGNFAIAYEGTVPTKEKPRYISLAPSTTEILFALGLDDEIVGVTLYCNYPPKAQTKELVGNFSRPNIEKIIYLKPDYIFCTGTEQAPVVTELKQLKLNFYVSNPLNFKELFNSIRDIAKVTHKDNQAEVLIKSIQDEIEEVTRLVKLIPEKNRPKVFIEIWGNPLTTAGKGSFLDELITLAGGINIAYDTKKAHSIFSAEEVIRRNPDCIILTYMDKEKPRKLMEKRLGWNNISALKNNRVYSDIDHNVLLRAGPRTAEALKEIYRRLYP